MTKILRITTVPISLQVLLKGQPSYFKNNGFEYFTCSASDGSVHDKELKLQGNHFVIPFTRTISPLNDLLALFKLILLIIKIKPTIVHTHTPKAGIIGMLAAKLARVPIRLHTVAGLPLMEAKGVKRKVLNIVERITSWSATFVYPNSFALKDFMEKEKLALKKKLRVIANGSSNGIDIDHFSSKNITIDTAAFRIELGIGKDDFVFVFVGRVVKDKGINELINSFSQISLEYNNCKLLIVGEYEDALNPINTKSKQLIQENVNIISMGFKNDVRPYLAISNCFVFPSYREGFPNVVMQAGSMELCSIVTDINGSNEIIINNDTGLIIQKKNSVQLKDAMKYIMNNHSESIRMGQNARLRISKNYDQKYIWNELLKEYNQHIENVHVF